MSFHSNTIRERLEARKKKVSTLIKGIEEHEQERDDAVQQHTKFSDTKYAAGQRESIFGSSRGSTDSDPSMASTVDVKNRISQMMTTPSEMPMKSKMKSGDPKSKNKKPLPSKSAKQTKSYPGPSDAVKNSKSATRQKETIININDGRGDRMPKSARMKLKQPMSVPSTAVTSTQSELIHPDYRDSKSILKSTKLSEIFSHEDIRVKTDDEENSSEEEGFLHIIEALNCIQNAKYIFMQRLLDYVEIEAAGVSFHTDHVDLAYQILNVEGQLLFLMQQQKLKFTRFIVYSKKSFENVLYDIYGNKVLKYIGPKVFMSKMTSRMTVTDGHDRILGYVKAFGTKVNYSIYNAIGERLFLVVSNLYLPANTTDFTILCRGHKIGTLRYGWKNTFHDLSYIDYETSGIEIPPELDEREKALLLGCLMLIEFFWYSPLTRLKLSLLFLGVFLLVIAIIILITPMLIDNPKVDPLTKSYYLAEKLDPPKGEEIS